MKAYKLRIELTDCQPTVWREIVIPEGVSFKRLHETIQRAMGWYDCHLYEFIVPNRYTYIFSDDDLYQEAKLDIQLAKLCDDLTDPLIGNRSHELQKQFLNRKVYRPTYKIDRFLMNHDKIIYIYDYGDNWEHDISLVEIIEDYPHVYPQVLDFEGACPPEDCGGTGGYGMLVSILSNPGHQDYEEVTNWLGSSVLKEYDIELVNLIMQHSLKLRKI